MVWTTRSVRRRLFPPGGSSVKNPQMLCSRHLRGLLSCLLRLFGRAPLISCVFFVQSCGKAVDECISISQFSSALFYFDAFTVHFASALSTIFVLYGFYAFAGRGVTVVVSQGIVLQVGPRFPPLFLVVSHRYNQLLGILLAKAAFSQSHLAPSLILLAVAFTSACNVLIIDNVPFTPLFTRIGADGACRPTVIMQLP